MLKKKFLRFPRERLLRVPSPDEPSVSPCFRPEGGSSCEEEGALPASREGASSLHRWIDVSQWMSNQALTSAHR